jgi:hypothetical protein
MICLLVMGSAILIVYNYQNETSYIDPATKKKVRWNHPFFQAAVIAFGQSMALIIYAIKMRIIRRNSKNHK